MSVSRRPTTKCVEPQRQPIAANGQRTSDSVLWTVRETNRSCHASPATKRQGGSLVARPVRFERTTFGSVDGREDRRESACVGYREGETCPSGVAGATLSPRCPLPMPVARVAAEAALRAYLRAAADSLL